MKLEITCKKATEYIIKREQRKLSLTGHIQLWFHFGICSFCKLFAKQSRLINQNARKIESHVEDSLTPEEKEKMVAGMQQ